MSKSGIIVLLLIVVILCVSGYFVYSMYLSPTGLKARQNSDIRQIEAKVEDHYTNLNGEPVDLTVYGSELLIVNVWASWSPYTPGEIETLARLKEMYHDTLTIRAVNRKETKETALAYLDSIGKRDGIEYIIDTSDHFYTSLGGYAMPETFIFDKIGNMVFHKRGVLDYNELVEQIQVLLQKEPS